MAMMLRYAGEFLSLSGVVWRCEILQESDSSFEIGDLDFSDNPLEIEWPETGKEDVICGSTATLRLLSPEDRTFIDLYSIAPGRIRLDVYRSGVLYWSGCLDPEFYEEPYDREAKYEVSLTFSDLGILSRLDYNLSGLQSLSAILADALSRAKINYTGVDTTLVSTRFADNSALSLTDLAIRSENFFDEDDTPFNCRDTIEGILRPLSLRIIQKCGKIWLYDLNALSLAAASVLSFNSSGQIIGTDRVFNNIKVTLSVYNESALLGDFEYTGGHSASLINRGNEVLNPERYSYYGNYEDGHIGTAWDYDWLNFTIFISRTEAVGLASIHPNCRYFYIQPLLGGTEISGIVYFFYTGGHGSLASGFPQRRGSALLPDNTVLMTTKRRYLASLSQDMRDRAKIRILVNLLLDPRYNPFEDKTGNEEGNYNTFEKYAGHVRIPVKIQLYDENGDVIFHYKNSELPGVVEERYATKNNTQGVWLPGAANADEAYLSWYDAENFDLKSGVLGWKPNRQSLPPLGEGLKFYPSLLEQPPGTFIPYPPVGGMLEIQVLAGVRIYAYGVQDQTQGFLGITRWFLLGAPEVTIVNNDSTYSVLDSGDVEYAGVLNEDAREDLELNEICGTMETPSPGARGLLLDSDGAPILKLSRAGRITQAEQLIIGTLYSQFAERKTKLSGSVDLLSEGIKPYTEPAQEPESRFMILSEVQNIREETSEIVAVEVVPDLYTEE